MIVVGDTELLEKILELVEEQADRPEVGAFVSKMRRPPVAELIVVNDRTAREGDVGHGQQIVVRATRTAMGRDEWCAAGREITCDAVPGFPIAEIDSAFCGRLEKRRQRVGGH